MSTNFWCDANGPRVTPKATVVAASNWALSSRRSDSCVFTRRYCQQGKRPSVVLLPKKLERITSPSRVAGSVKSGAESPMDKLRHFLPEQCSFGTFYPTIGQPLLDEMDL